MKLGRNFIQSGDREYAENNKALLLPEPIRVRA